jgi:hypothetical protein
MKYLFVLVSLIGVSLAVVLPADFSECSEDEYQGIHDLEIE